MEAIRRSNYSSRTSYKLRMKLSKPLGFKCLLVPDKCPPGSSVCFITDADLVRDRWGVYCYQGDHTKYTQYKVPNPTPIQVLIGTSDQV